MSAFLFAWYKASAANPSITSGSTQDIATALENATSLNLTATWSAKKADNSTTFTLGTDKVSLVDLADGKTYAYNGTADADHKQEVATRGGEQFVIVNLHLAATGLTSSQYGTYSVSVSAGAIDATPNPASPTNQDILYIYKTKSATSVTWGASNFDKSLSLDNIVFSEGTSISYDCSFIVVGKGLEVDQTSTYKSGTLTANVAF